MKIEDKKVVSLTYRLVVDGQVRDEAKKDNPLEFIFGVGSLLPKFEEYIKARRLETVLSSHSLLKRDMGKATRRQSWIFP